MASQWCYTNMAARLLFGVCAVLMAIAVANAASAEPASVVVGLAKCADCTRKNMNAEAVFKGLQVAFKCKNVKGEYESKAVGKLDGAGAFSVPLAADLHGADCHAQLHRATGKPCPGQEPSAIVPQSEDTFVAVAGKTHYQSAECASATICGPIKKHIIDHFHKKKPVPPKPKSEPKPEYHPPTPTYHPPTPTYGGSTPIYHAPALKTSDTFCGKIKKHIMDHFHKKPVPPKPKPESKPEYYHPPTPEYHPPTPTYGGSQTPIYHPPSLKASATFCGKIKKHIMDHFHKNPMPPKPKKPEYHPPTTPSTYHPPTPTYGGSTPIYHPPAKH